MATLDWIVLSAYLVAIVAFGLWVGRGSRRIEDFFLAGRQMRWWAVGLSVMATQISAITFVGTTGQAYTDGMRFLVFYFGLPFAMVVLCVTFVPFFFRARVTTAYEYLERRFDGRTRTLTSLLFLFGRGLSVGVTLYAPSLVLSVLLGWSEGRTILLMGGSTILYVVYGGNKSVIWTDVVQMALIWLGIFLCVAVAILQLPGDFSLRDALGLAQTTGRLRIVDTQVSLKAPYTLWSGLVGGFFLMLAYFGCDQSQVQRYLAGSNLTQSRLSLLFNAFLKVPMQFLILLMGVLVFVFYHFHVPPLLWNAAELRRLERDVAQEELAAVRERFLQAHEARREAASAFARDRHEGRATHEATQKYLAAEGEVTAVRGEVKQLIERVNGGKPYNDTNYIFPSYVVTQLPRGLAGLVIAVIFAAAMSTLSGEFNSLATATMVDFYMRFVRPDQSERSNLLVSRLLTAFWGLLACGVALQAGRFGSAIETVNRFGSYVYGPILGVFLLAVLTRASASGAFWGALAGEGVITWVVWKSPVHFLWYTLIGAVSVVVVGLVITLLGREEPA